MGESLPEFDPEFADPAQWAAMYRACGLQIVPAWMPRERKDYKRPYLTNWKQYQGSLVDDRQFSLWYDQASGLFRERPNLGLLTGACSGNRFIVDFDTQKGPQAQAWWDRILAEHNNRIDLETVEQITGGSGKHKVFEAPPGFVVPTCKTDIGVDIRGEGAFAVLPPSEHASGRAYAWALGRAPWEVEILDAPQWLLDEIVTLAKQHGGTAGHSGRHQTNGAGPQEPGFNAFGQRTDGREEYMRDLIWAALIGFYVQSPIGPPPAADREAVWADYERNCAPKTPLAGESNADGLEREGRGRGLFDEKWADDIQQWNTDIAAEAKERVAKEKAEAPKASEPPPDPETSPTPIKLRSAFPIDRMAIPPRDWVIPGLLLRKNLSVLVAPPGSGKSLLMVQIALMVGAGMQWAGWTPRKREKVLIINAEDDIDEMHRRMFVAAEVMKIDQNELVDWVMLPDQLEIIVIARADNRTKTVVRTPLIEALVATIIAERIGVIVVDPFAETFEGDENSNSEVKWAGMLWREVARRTGCALMLVHHTRKYAGSMAGDADASRGGGALIGTARILGTLFVMTEDEAKAMNVSLDQRGDYVRYDDAKANHSRKGSVKWFEKRSVELGNSTAFLPGDDVGVLVPWQPPGALDGVSMHDIGLALDAIDRGTLDEDGRPTGQFYAAGMTGPTKERWVGKVLMRLLGSSEDGAKT